MQRKKRHTNYAAAAAQQEAADDDRLELVKAAAWAWHQHSSSSISKLQQGHREFPSVRSRQRSSHGPSRYRLESLSSTASRPVAAKNTPMALLDVYETERITRELERLVATGEKRDKSQGKKMVQKKKNKGGSLLGRHAVKICGSSTNDTVAEIEPLVGRHHESSMSDVLLQRRRLCKKIA